MSTFKSVYDVPYDEVILVLVCLGVIIIYNVNYLNTTSIVILSPQKTEGLPKFLSNIIINAKSVSHFQAVLKH